MLNESPNPKIDLDQIRPSKEWFTHLPSINQWLLGTGGVCLVFGLFCLIGIPILSAAGNSVKVAIHPYTAAGKREACIANLQQISEALNQYRQDYDGKFPPAEYTRGGKRVTWMTLLRERGLDAGVFKCPANRSTRGNGETTGGYAFNPVFYERAIETTEGDDSSRMILVADRGDLHDSNLIPPFSIWGKKSANNETTLESTNLSPNHSGQVAILYADGHVDTQVVDPQDAIAWGGEHLRATGLQRLESQYPLLLKIQTAKAAAFRNQKQKLYRSLEQLYLFQKETQGHKFLGDATEERMWRGAYYLKTLGEGNFEKQLNKDLHQHSQDLLAQVGTNWQKYESEFGFSMEYPGAWRIDPQVDGRYRTTYFRSESPHVRVAVELGERTTPSYSPIIDWTGMERDRKARYGKNYKRIAMDSTDLGDHYASTWEFEIKSPGSPKLRKRYIGYSTAWSSVILSVTTPAAEWNNWEQTFTRMADSFGMNH